MIGYLSSADVFTWDNFSFQWQGEHQHNSVAKAAVTSYVVVKSSFGEDSLIKTDIVIGCTRRTDYFSQQICVIFRNFKTTCFQF